MATPVINGSPTPVVSGATGWVLAKSFTSFSGGETTLTRIYRGPYSTLATAYAGIAAMNPVSLSPTSPEGSAVATLTATWGSDPDNHEIREPTYEVIPVREAVNIDAFPYWRVKYGQKEALARAMQNGTAATIGADELGAEVNVLRQLKLSGVESYERTIFSLRITRYFDNQKNYPSLLADYAKVNTQCAWAAIKTLNALTIPDAITEPKMMERATTGAWSAVALEWKLSEVAPQYQGKFATIVWTWDGAPDWDDNLYKA